MKGTEKFSFLPVGDIKDGRVYWRDVPKRESHRVAYNAGTNPDKYVIKDNILYATEIKPEYLKKLLAAAKKIAGGDYVLALELNGGEYQNKEFRTIYSAIKHARFSTWHAQKKYMDLLEKYIKQKGAACGAISDGAVMWLNCSHLSINKSTLQSYYSRHKELFVVVDKVLYFITPQSIVVENMYWKCIGLAGGEYKLAKATSGGDKKKLKRHLSAFRRMSFSRADSVSYYAKVFERYLDKNLQLLDKKVEI